MHSGNNDQSIIGGGEHKLILNNDMMKNIQ